MFRRNRWLRLPSQAACAAAVVTLCLAATARANVVEVAPGDDVEGAMNALQPGDELVLAGGTYTLTDAWHVTIMGTAELPIKIHAKAGEYPHLYRPATDQNIIDFDNAAYLEFSGIEVSGGSAGLRLINVNFMTIRDCEVHDTADVAIAANSGSDYQGLQVIHNHIHNTGGTGEGMYIGCNYDACRVHDSVFSQNYIHDTNGASVSQGDGIEIKEGSYNNIVSDNVIHDTGYPCIITYSTVGNGGPNVIERNALWNCGDHAIQSAADVIIRNNIILGSVANGIVNQPHQTGTPSNIQILHNTVLHPTNDAIVSTGITGSVLIANNAVYSQQGSAVRVSGDLTQVVVAGNVGMGTLDGVTTGLTAGDITTDFVAASFSGVPPNDVFPIVGSALIAAGDPQYVVTDDFNGTPRNGVADVGAYLYVAGENPGWQIAMSFKSGGSGSIGGGSDAGDAGGATVTDASAGTGGGGTSGAGGVTSSSGGVTGSGAANTGGSASGGVSGATNTGGTIGGDVEGGAGAASENAGSKDSSGCGCRTTTHASSRQAMILLALLLSIAQRRRGR